MSNTVQFSVTGTPVAQGSMVAMRGRVRHSDNDRLMGWRNDVAAACLKEMKSARIKPEFRMYKPWAGPVDLTLIFTYKPSRKADAEEMKQTAPDLDKLARAVLDALTGVLYVDDKQVAMLECHKVYGCWLWDDGPEDSHMSVTARLMGAVE